MGIKNRFVKFMRTPDWSNGPIVFFHMLVAAITNQTIKLTNKLVNKTEYDFTNENVTISSIKKSNALSKLISFVLSKKEPIKDLEEKKGKQL